MASARAREATKVEELEPSVDMSSMIDLVFLLLFFFMVSSHLITVRIDSRVNSPVADNAKVDENATGKIVINLLADGSTWDNTPEELPTADAITDFVSQTAAGYGPEAKVRLLLRADKDVETRHIKRVVEAAGKAGVTDVVFGAYVVGGTD